MVTFPLQAAPRRKIPKFFLEALDSSIRATVKGVIGLPEHQCPDTMIYAPRNLRGLGILRASWEVPLQHFAIAKKLAAVRDPLFHVVYDCQEEMNLCKRILAVEGTNTRQLRRALRERSFADWAKLSYAGVGVKHNRLYPKANSAIMARQNLSCAKWVEAIKLSFGYANLKGVPGVGEKTMPNRCRRCDNETETVSHVLGYCHFMSRQRIARHDALKFSLKKMLKANGMKVKHEAECKSTTGDNHRVYLVAFPMHTNTDKAYIIDPTIRWEDNKDVGAEVHAEKRRIYEPCIPFLKQRFAAAFGNREYEVIGLWMGARGTISKNMVEFFDRFQLDRRKLLELSNTVVWDSLDMLHNHIYAT